MLLDLAWQLASLALGLLAGIAVVVGVYAVVHRLIPRRGRRSVTVLVLGDFGRSPRMQYHTLSLSQLVPEVHVVAYQDSPPLAELLRTKNVMRHSILQPPALPAGLPRAAFVLYAPIKVLIQTLSLVFTLLFRTPAPSHLLMQNPPAIPALPVAVIVCLLRNSSLVVDWHNYGYSILALKLGQHHLLVRFSKSIEKFFGRWATSSFCVTDAMADDLRRHWGVGAVTLHDRPAAIFQPVSLEITHDLFRRLQSDNKKLADLVRQRKISEPHTLVTTADQRQIQKSAQRPALIVSSTSWTPDEDFGILLEAFRIYDQHCDVEKGLPEVLCIITGKGPLRSHYEELLAKSPLKHVTVVTAWLAMEDYPKLLASADLGVSLHTSSSGLDLPMKVVDMFGSGLPVCAANFKCLGELVKHGENGMVFDTADQLSRQLIDLLRGFPHTPQLDKLRNALRAFREHSWQKNWQNRAAPAFAR